MTYYKPRPPAAASPTEGGRRLKPAYKGGRCSKLHLERNRRTASCPPPRGKASPLPGPLTQSSHPEGCSSTDGSRRLNATVVIVVVSSRLLASRCPGGGTGSFLLLFLGSLPALVGRTAKAVLFSLRHRQFSRLALKGGRESFLFLRSPVGELRSPTPPPLVRPRCGLSPLFVLAGLTFGRSTRRQFSQLAPEGAAERASSSVPASLACSRWVGRRPEGLLEVGRRPEGLLTRRTQQQGAA